jgi:hypothetical protein
MGSSDRILSGIPLRSTPDTILIVGAHEGRNAMSKKTVKFNESGIEKLPNDKPVCTRLPPGGTPYRRCRALASRKTCEHLPGGKDTIPGAKVQIEQMPFRMRGEGTKHHRSSSPNTTNSLNNRFQLAARRRLSGAGRKKGGQAWPRRSEIINDIANHFNTRPTVVVISVSLRTLTVASSRSQRVGKRLLIYGPQAPP